MIDHGHLAAIAERDPRLYANKILGPEGSAMVRRLTQRVRHIYRVISPEQLSIGMTVVEPLNPRQESDCLALVVGRGLTAVDEIVDFYRECVTVVPKADGSLLTSEDVLSPTDVPDHEAVYHFDPKVGETIQVAGRTFVPDNPAMLPSAFSASTFATLEKALRRYALDFARYGTLGNLRSIWRDDARLMFHAKPEETMRRSLEDFLQASLREIRSIDVRPETPVDESHPIDLRVVFTHTNRTALIEIKWMGESADTAGGSHVTYRDARAKSGASQLAGYLDLDRPRSTGHQVVGYLVVFDARRQGISPTTTSIDRAKGMYYESRDVAFQPEIVARPDFAAPLRMFMEPVCQ